MSSLRRSVVDSQATARLFYVHDPMCSWCWAFRPVWQSIRETFGARIPITSLLGGLAPDSASEMPGQTRAMIQRHWRTIEKRVPGTRFNYDFWTTCRPRRSTWPACRAVIAAKAQGAQYEETMILAIQQAYYLQAQNPSDDDLLIALAEKIHLNRAQFREDLHAPATVTQLADEIALGNQMGARGFPSLILDLNGTHQLIPIDYRNAETMIARIERALPSAAHAPINGRASNR